MFTKKFFTFAAVATLSVCMYGFAATAGETITDKDLYGPITTSSGSEVVRNLGAGGSIPTGMVSHSQALNFAQPQLHHESTDVWDQADNLFPARATRSQALHNAEVLHDWNSEDIVK